LGITVNCPDSTLAPQGKPGDQETCTGTYAATQADVDAGSITNTATAHGTWSATVYDSSQQSVTVHATPNASLTIAKSSSTTNYAAAGNTISYSYLVTNTGTDTLSGITVTDSLGITVSCPDSTLGPGAHETCTASYTVKGSDVTAGSVCNTAQATGTWSGNGDTYSSAVSNQVCVPSTYTTTVDHPESNTAALGGTDEDVAIVTGNELSGAPAGTVTFYVCGATASPEPCTSQADEVGSPETLIDPAASSSHTTSAAFTADLTGYWCFAAYYNGESSPVTYAVSNDTTTDGCFYVSQATTTDITTPANATINLGQSDNDLATITGNAAGGSPTGTVSFYECGPYYTGPGNCTSQSDQVGSAVALTTGANSQSTATSATFKPPSVGYWCFAADYNGSSQYLTSSDTSADECFFVKGPLNVLTTSCPSGTVGHAYSCQMQAAGGTEPYKWSMTGSYAENSSGGDLHINKSTGLITGRPHRAATYTITVKVLDSSHPRQHAKEVLTITINS